MSKEIQKIYDKYADYFSELTCADVVEECGHADVEREIYSLQESISLWRYVIACDIKSGNKELVKMDRRRLQQAKIQYRNAKLMMQKLNRVRTATA